MTNIFFISDTHFFHKRILTFTDNLGNLVRPGFSSVEDMNETIVENWNKKIKPGDHVYHLGDVTFYYGSDFNNLMSRLNGRKRLVVGNHDELKNENLMKHFEKIMVCRLFKDNLYPFVCTHIPIDELSFGKALFNVHGHTHDRNVTDKNRNEKKQYLNVCVEKTNYMPLHYDEVIEKLKLK